MYAGIALLTGIAGLTFARHFLTGHMGPWMNGGSGPPTWFFPAILQVVWVKLLVRVGLIVAAAWGLLEEAQWGRVLAIIAAIWSLIHLPLGTAMGIWTLVVLLGYRNATLYEQL